LYLHGFFIFQQKYTKFAGLELIEKKDKCLKNKTSEYKSEQQQPWFSSWFDTPYITSFTKSETIAKQLLYG
jgi:hypothetical protein